MKFTQQTGLLLLISFSFIAPNAYSQCTGANMAMPINAGTLSPGSIYSDVQNNSTACFGNDIGNASNDIYYKFTISANATINISHCGAGFDTYIHLLDINGSVITTADDNGPFCSGTAASLTRPLAAGTYYAVSEGYGSSTGSITTRISIPAGSLSDSWTLNGTNLYNANSGNIGIGINNPQAKLAVNGDIFSKKIKVTQTGWPDYVFDKSYKLPPLKDVETYINKYKHLPGIASAKEIEVNGLDLGENQANLLKKIEELTMYLIEQNAQLEVTKENILQFNKKMQEQEQIIKHQDNSLQKQQQLLMQLKKKNSN